MTNIFEAKLSAEDRKRLDSKLFGLPKERKYPLNDEEHIRKAIQFFNFCPKIKRNELATNINKRMREMNLKIEVDKKNPFYKYVNKDFVLESLNEIDEPVRLYHVSFLNDADIKYIEQCQIAKFETESYSIHDMVTINNTIYLDYIDYINFLIYNGEKLDTSFYTCVHDIVTILRDKFKSGTVEPDDTYNTIVEGLNVFAEMDPSCANKAYIYRELLLLKKMNGILIRKERNKNIIDLLDKLLIMYRPIGDMIGDILIRVSGDLWLHRVFNTNLLQYHFTHLTKMLYNEKIKLEKQLYIMNMPDKGFEFNNQIRTEYDDLVEHSHLLSEIDYQIDTVFVSGIDGGRLTQFLDNIALLRLTRMTEVSDVILLHDMYSQPIYISIINNKVYLTLMNKMNNSLLTFVDISDRDCVQLHIVRATFVETNINSNRILTEGFTIDEDGNMKITISSKKSYMDEYSQNHKLLIENWKNKNYEGVKKNLAFIFALINIIERDPKYKKRDPKMIKARAFAINDFKTYLKKLTSIEKDFDFVEYYNNSDYDKLVVNVPKQTIIGIKNLMKLILK